MLLVAAWAMAQEDAEERWFRNEVDGNGAQMFPVDYQGERSITPVALLEQQEELPPPSKLQIGYIKSNKCSFRSKVGHVLQVHYVAKHYKNPIVIESSYDDEKLEFRLGSNQVIEGWDIGLVNMCIGDIRRLIIPPDQAYGEEGAPPEIPPNSTMIFEVELLDIIHTHDDL